MVVARADFKLTSVTALRPSSASGWKTSRRDWGRISRRVHVPSPASVADIRAQDLADLKATIGKVLDRLTTAESRLSLIQTSLQGQLSTTTQRADEIMAQLRALPSEAAERAAAAGRRTFATTVKYILGAVVVLGGLVVAFSYFRAKGGKYARDEGSFANGSHARGQSFSLAMGQVGNSMGFRQRGGPGKKMI